MIRLPDLDEIGKNKIAKDCTVRQHQLIAIAFTKTGRIISRETNRLGAGEVSNWSWHAEEYLANKLYKTKVVHRVGVLLMEYVGHPQTHVEDHTQFEFR